MNHRQHDQRAFTIVELLIVIVVIGVLAAVAIIAYNGVQQRARVSAASSALTQSAKKLAAYLVDNITYPTDLATIGITNTSDVSYQYSYNNSTNPKTFCITATSGNVSYQITQDSSPTAGGCAGHGVGGVAPITNLALNPSIETNIASTGNTGVSPGTITQSNEQAYSGTYSQKLVVASGRGWFISDGVLTAGTTVYWSFWAYSPTVVPMQPYWERSSTYTGGPGGATVNTVPNTWTKVSGTVTLDASQVAGTSFKFGYHRGTPAGGEVVYIDGVMITTSGASANFADGTTANWAWNGTAHNSTSTGPAI